MFQYWARLKSTDDTYENYDIAEQVCDLLSSMAESSK